MKTFTTLITAAEHGVVIHLVVSVHPIRAFAVKSLDLETTFKVSE